MGKYSRINWEKMYHFKYVAIISALSWSYLLTAAIRCESLLSEQTRFEIHTGAEFLHSHNTIFHNNQSVQRSAKRSNLSVSSPPVEKLESWLIAWEKIKSQPSAQRILKYKLLNQLVIQEIPESYLRTLQQKAREQGHGDIEYTPEEKQEYTHIIQNNQRESLSQWIDYFFSEDTNIYPTWTKLWSFRQMIKLGEFNKERAGFLKRSQSSVAPFPELNREALAYVLDGILKIAKGNNLSEYQDQLFIKLLRKNNFGKLYAYAILKTTTEGIVNLDITDGKWIKYEQESDYRHLKKSLSGKDTGWCTAGGSFAENHLKSGNFYVYYSNNEYGLPVWPRIAIRMIGGQIGEVRGVGPDQNLDFGITKSNILEDKLKEFGDQANLYFKKVKDMRELTNIENKLKNRQELTGEDIRFLYEIDEIIQGFGYGKDPRILQIIEDRNIRKDLSHLFNIDLARISLGIKEALFENILYHYGDIKLERLTSAEGLVLPKEVSGNIDLSGLTSAEGLVLPKEVGGWLDLSGLTSAEGLVLLKKLVVGST